MDEYEPITVELRSYIRKATSTTDTCWWMSSNTHDVLDLCDAIDAVHAQLERDYKTACEVNERQDADYVDLKRENESLRKKVKHQSVQLTEVQGALERRNEGVLKQRWQKELDRLKAERDSMAAALDAAQGEHAYAPESHYMMLPKDADGVPIHVGDVMEWPTTGETFEVVGIGDGTLFYVENGSECADWTGATTKCHYHTPTVEDVLCELLNEYRDGGCVLEEERLSEYAAKLRLAGES